MIVEEALVDVSADQVAVLDDLTRPEWLELRKEGLGGSDAAAVLGLDEWRSPFELYLEKIGEHPDGDRDRANEAMEWGQILEEPICQRFASKTGIEIIRPRHLLRHPEHRFIMGNPDRFLLHPDERGPGILEAKTTSDWQSDLWDEEPAERALIQWTHYAAICDVTWGYIACLIGGQRLVYYRVERDDELVRMLIELEAEFWERVQTLDQPPVTGMHSDSELLKRMWKAEKDKKVLLGDEALDIQARYWDAHKALKKAEWDKDCAGNELRLLLGDAEFGVLANGNPVATNKEIGASNFNEKRFRAEMPNFSRTYVEPNPYRRLDVKGKPK